MQCSIQFATHASNPKLHTKTDNNKIILTNKKKWIKNEYTINIQWKFSGKTKKQKNKWIPNWILMNIMII